MEFHAYRVYNKTMGRVAESCYVEFFKDNGSREEPCVYCDIGDTIPSQAIGRMGIASTDPLRDTLGPTWKDQASTQIHNLHLTKLLLSSNQMHLNKKSKLEILNKKSKINLKLQIPHQVFRGFSILLFWRAIKCWEPPMLWRLAPTRCEGSPPRPSCIVEK
jgi:hypothetical protein